VTDKISPEHRIAASRRLAIGMKFFLSWGLIGCALIVLAVVNSFGRTADKGFFSAGSITIFSLGLMFLVMGTIFFRALNRKRKELLDSGPR
jgi:hypothetical protein